MLDPDYLDQASDMVGAVYSDIESDMLTYLCEQLLDQDIEELGQRGTTAVTLLSQTHATELLSIVNSYSGDVNNAVAKTVTDAIGRSDKKDTAVANVAKVAASVTSSQPRQITLTIKGIESILERDNVAMVQGALSLWNRIVAKAVTQVNTGYSTAEQAIREAVRAMMDQGISTITYRNSTTGRQTITNNIDVAVRRHVRTQLEQDGMRRTLQICKDAGIDLVEVTSHGGARPSHAKWQGRVYSLVGEVEIDGVRYKDFYTETDYGSVDGLGGANCRHSFGPWIPGTARSYDPNPEHPSGLSNSEVYAMIQEQRRREREIRKTKRELKGAHLIAKKDGSLQNLAEVERLKLKLSRQQKNLREYIDSCNTKGKALVLQRSINREWAGDMPKIKKQAVANRTIAEFMDSKSVKQTLEKTGISKSAARKALSQELKTRGIDSHNFQALSKTNQQSIFKSALNTGAIADPQGKGRAAAERHAKSYYREITSRNTASTISKIAKASSMSTSDARRAYDHLFIEEHELADGVRRFDPDYDMAQSIQRLIDTNNPEKHDLLLFKHEALEAKYMSEGMSQREAHIKANKTYNYEAALKKWLNRNKDS